MEDWSKRLDLFLEFDDREVLKDAGKISMKIAKEFTESEFEKYRITQDILFESDFDKLLKKPRNCNRKNKDYPQFRLLIAKALPLLKKQLNPLKTF
jgi:hypothetical protein